MTDQNIDNKPTEPTQTVEPTATTPATTGGKTFTEAEVEQLIKERLDREKVKREKAAQDAAAAATAEAAKKNGEWQKLAEQREKELSDAAGRLAELDALHGKAERYEATLKKYLDAQKAGLPPHILALLEKLDPVDQLEYITANADVLRKPDAKAPGTPPSNTTRGGNKPKVDESLPKVRVSY